MTWRNLPCDPTLDAMGWVEIQYVTHPHNTWRSRRVRRAWGAESAVCNSVAGSTVADLAWDWDPDRDGTLLARMTRTAGPCNSCGRARPAGQDDRWHCHEGDFGAPGGASACPGSFALRELLVARWGAGGEPVFFEGGPPEYRTPRPRGTKQASTVLIENLRAASVSHRELAALLTEAAEAVDAFRPPHHRRDIPDFSHLPTDIFEEGET